ncbi:MAG: ribosomal protein L11 methyltransferase [Maribacter sp.]|jgi:ribosomal protein L11 methyltransferase
MDYYVYKIQAAAQWAEIIQAFMGEMPFDTFKDNDTGFDAYIPANAHSAEVEESVGALKENFPFEHVKERIVAQNWNKIWESNFNTVLVGQFCGIRADFHPPFEKVEHEIVINPKMAFGTGHHETTYMVIEFMKDIEFKGKSVFDYGCGTGILAILAEMRGSQDIDAVDIEEPAYDNTIENKERNSTPNINCFHGTLDDVPERQYDIILANINRNVILDSFSALHQRLKPGGILLSSGYLLEDKEMMDAAHLQHGFLPETSKNRGKWIATKAYRRY